MVLKDTWFRTQKLVRKKAAYFFCDFVVKYQLNPGHGGREGFLATKALRFFSLCLRGKIQYPLVCG